jgi:hypothetical protein
MTSLIFNFVYTLVFSEILFSDIDPLVNWLKHFKTSFIALRKLSSPKSIFKYFYYRNDMPMMGQDGAGWGRMNKVNI